MGLPSSNIGTPLFEPKATQGGAEFGVGTPGTPQAQPIPFPTMPSLTPTPQALPQFTQQEMDALRQRFMSNNFGGQPGSMPFMGGNFPWQR